MNRAVEILETTITKWPWRVDLRLLLLRIHNGFGELLAKQGNRPRALEQYRSALSVGTVKKLRSVG